MTLHHAPPPTLTTVGTQSPQRHSSSISRQPPAVAQQPTVSTVSRSRQQAVLQPPATQPGPSTEREQWTLHHLWDQLCLFQSRN